MGRWVRNRLGKGLTTAGALVAVVAGTVGILFQVDPRLSPCLGGRNATFTGAPVFPQYPYQRYLIDLGYSQAVASTYPNWNGAEVRYSYEANDLRGDELVLRVTLVKLAKDGTIASVDTDVLDQRDLAMEEMFTPEQCSQAGGKTFWLRLPAGRGRYEMILELYVGLGYTDRVALGQTPVFDG